MPKVTRLGRVSFYSESGWIEHFQSKDARVRMVLNPKKKTVRLWIGEHSFSFNFDRIKDARSAFDGFRVAFAL